MCLSALYTSGPLTEIQFMTHCSLISKESIMYQEKEIFVTLKFILILCMTVFVTKHICNDVAVVVVVVDDVIFKVVIVQNNPPPHPIPLHPSILPLLNGMHD